MEIYTSYNFNPKEFAPKPKFVHPNIKFLLVISFYSLYAQQRNFFKYKYFQNLFDSTFPPYSQFPYQKLQLDNIIQEDKLGHSLMKCFNKDNVSSLIKKKFKVHLKWSSKWLSGFHENKEILDQNFTQQYMWRFVIL